MIEAARIEVDGGYGDDGSHVKAFLTLEGDFVDVFERYLDDTNATSITLELHRSVAEDPIFTKTSQRCFMDKFDFRVKRITWSDIKVDPKAFIEYYSSDWVEYLKNSKDDPESEKTQWEFIRESLYEIGLAEYLYSSDVDDGVTILETDEEYELE